MKKLIYGISILFLFVSCKTAKEIQKTDPINDPSVFIGNHKAKAMVLGVFHFSNPQLDSYKPKFPLRHSRKTKAIGVGYPFGKNSRIQTDKNIIGTESH